MTEKQMRVLSIVATLTAVGMYVSYIPQIQNTLRATLARRCNPSSPPSTAHYGLPTAF